MTGFDTQETKLPTYWSTSFTKICLGMRIGNQTRFVSLNQASDSLHSLIADGAFRATNLGRNSWKALIGPHASLQQNCEKEGFNAMGGKAYSRVRIGIVTTDANRCHAYRSRIGFGMNGFGNSLPSCGIRAPTSADNGYKLIPTFGYILVQ